MSSFKVGDIYSISFTFDDANQSKSRPAMIFDIKGDGTLVLKVLKITSKNNGKWHDQFKQPLTYWKEAGLDKQSWVQTHGALLLSPAEFMSVSKKYIGQMHDDDLEAVRRKYEYMLQVTASS